MNRLRMALGASVVAHAALAVVLAVVGAPTSVVVAPPAARVTLMVSPESASAARALRPVARENAQNPRIEDLSTAVSDTRTPAGLLPMPSIRLDMPATPPRADPPAARAGPDTARPVESPPVSTTPPHAPAQIIPAPDTLPSPAGLLAQLEGARSSPEPAALPADETAAEVAQVERLASFGRRTPRVQPLPEFPEVLRREGREAEVTARLRIDPSGAVVSVFIERGSGDTAVDNAVERIVRDYLFERTDGDTIDEGVVTFHFRLKKGF